MLTESPSRGLVVDDDPAVLDLLSTQLRSRGIAADIADDGAEAAQLLRENEYSLAFIDLLLPEISGEGLLRQIESGDLRRPGSLAVISAAANLAGLHAAGWAQKVTLLSKPFAPADLTAFIARSFPAPARLPVLTPIVFGGIGLWSDSASIVALRRGARCINAAELGRVVELAEMEHPIAVVLGPPFETLDVMQAAARIKALPRGAEIPVFVALAREDARLADDLRAVGVDRVVTIAGGVAALSDELLALANLRRRVHRRVPLRSPVHLRDARALHLGTTIDIGEGGLGIELPAECPGATALLVEFTLPGDGTPIRASSEIAWVQNPDPSRPGARLGLRFTQVDAPDRIREYVQRF